MPDAPDLTALTARATAAQGPLAAVCRAAEAAYVEANANCHRLTLAQNLLAAQVPADAVVTVTDWAEESNGDGTYDLDIGEVLDAEGNPNEEIGDLGGQFGGIPAGRSSSGTDWDVFFEDPKAAFPRIVVARVYAWVNGLGTDA